MGLFEEATREKAKLRLALTGVSGAGKTLSALYLAYGITGDWGKVALIDTEHRRGKFYAGRSDLPTPTGKYLYAELAPPYSPERYEQFVRDGMEAVGPDGVVIVDSFSHAWSNEGGVLEIKDRISSRAGQTSYTAWAEAGKIQNAMVNTILSVNCHTIVTMRSRMDYALVENEKGKMVPKKLGLAPVQRDDTEYEFDIVLNIDRDHIATASKDTTFLDRYGDIITPELGRKLKEWLDEGEDPGVCGVCGNLIRPYKNKSASELAKGSLELYGEKMCAGCLLARTRAEKAAQAPKIVPEEAETR